MTPGKVVLNRLKRAAVLIIGGIVLLIGIASLVLPGPAFVLIPAGLSILAIEFAWARRWLHQAKQLACGRKTETEKTKP